MKSIISVPCRVMMVMMMIAVLAAAQVTGAAASDPSPAVRSIAAARQAISDKPTQYGGYNLLAVALVRRAEETSDASFYAEAEDAVKKSRELAPNKFATEKLEVSILLGEQEFPAALEAARALNKR